MTNTLAYGYCECGCGQKTVVSPHDHNYYGYKKGVPRRVVHGHHVYKTPKLPDAPETIHAWAAGIIDGEGCIHLQQTQEKDVGEGKAYRQSALSVSVAQSGFELPLMLSVLKETYGGSIGNPTRPTVSHKPAYRWIVSAALAEAVLICVTPYLVQKRDQALIALEYRKNGLGIGKAALAAEYAIRLSEAKKR